MAQFGAYYWENEHDSRGFPEICLEQCGALMEQARQQPAEIDLFESDCTSGSVEYEDTMLQGSPESPKRRLSILNMCTKHDVEAFSETYVFECPNVD